MDYILGKLEKTTKVSQYKKMISDISLYSFIFDCDNYVSFTVDQNLEEDMWFGIENFDKHDFCIELLKSTFEPTNFEIMNTSEKKSLEYIVSVQNQNEYYFQRISQKQLKIKTRISIGEHFLLSTNVEEIIINDIPDAIFIKNRNLLLFRNLSHITGIFHGIENLYREATRSEVLSFLNSDYITTVNNFSENDVKTLNRKRIAIVIELLKLFDKEQKTRVFHRIEEFYPNLIAENGNLIVGNEKDLKLLLYGIMQRFYITPDGKEKRIANQVIKIG